MTTSIICLLAGLVLGQRLKVLVLVPATALIAALAIIGGLVGGSTFRSVLLVAVGAAVSLQVGYLLGLGINQVLIGVRAIRTNANSVADRDPTRRPAH